MQMSKYISLQIMQFHKSFFFYGHNSIVQETM